MARGAKRPATGMSRAELAWMPLFASLRSGHATRDSTVLANNGQYFYRSFFTNYAVSS